MVLKRVSLCYTEKNGPAGRKGAQTMWGVMIVLFPFLILYYCMKNGR